MKAAELYIKTLQGYSSILPALKISLSSYCKEHRVNYRGLCDWLRANTLPVSGLTGQETPELPVPPFAPVSILTPESSVKKSYSPSLVLLLKGVEITCPNGLHVSIREISGKDMSVLIDQLTPH